VYAVERFTEAEHLRNAAFAAPPGVPDRRDPETGAFGIHVATDAACRTAWWSSSAPRRPRSCAARVWHPTQTFEELSDQRVRLTFTCASMIPVVSWVLEWGPHARAIEPAGA